MFRTTRRAHLRLAAAVVGASAQRRACLLPMAVWREAIDVQRAADWRTEP